MDTRPFRFTLLGDGASDRSLIPILGWTLAAIPGLSWRGTVAQMADLRGLEPPAHSLAHRLRQTIQHFPCDVLFVHRDAEGHPVDWRIEEVRIAASNSGISSSYVPVVPVQMTEAWLLIDELAIRRAAGNPHGKVAIAMPPLTRPWGCVASLQSQDSGFPPRAGFPVTPRTVGEHLLNERPAKGLSYALAGNPETS